MRNRFLVILPLMLAYLLMLSHDVIPHHHHHTLVEAAHHHAVEHSNHHHHDGDTEGHEHTMHMVHSPEFGSYLPNTSASINIKSISLDYYLSSKTNELFSCSQTDKVSPQWYEGNPPPLISHFSSSFPFRGPPIAFI